MLKRTVIKIYPTLSADHLQLRLPFYDFEQQMTP